MSYQIPCSPSLDSAILTSIEIISRIYQMVGICSSVYLSRICLYVFIVCGYKNKSFPYPTLFPSLFPFVSPPSLLPPLFPFSPSPHSSFPSAPPLPTLPTDIYQLSELHYLDVSSNSISRLPITLRLMVPALQQFTAEDNPLEYPPPHVGYTRKCMGLKQQAREGGSE